jgi:hypothetical protein
MISTRRTALAGLAAFMVSGQAIPGSVVKADGETVEMRSREYSRIVVRMDAIDAAAMAWESPLDRL